MNEEVNREISIDINTAEVEELIKIPGIGPELANRIVASRPFMELDDLKKVSGINTVFIERITPYVSLTSPQLDEDDLQKLAGASEGIDEVSTESAITDEDEEPIFPLEPIEEQDISDEVAPSDEVHEVLAEEEATPPEGAPVTEKEAPTRQRVATVTFTRSQLIWIAVGSVFVTLFLSLLLSLGILAGVNGGRLRYASPAQVSALTVRANGLKSAIDSTALDLASLRKRVDNLDSLNGRVTTVEESVSEISSNMDIVSTQVDELNQDVDELTSQVETLQKQNERHANFFSGLMELMQDLFGSEESNK